MEQRQHRPVGFRPVDAVELFRRQPANVAVLEQREGRFEFVDNANTPRTGRIKLFTAATVVAGKQIPRT